MRKLLREMEREAFHTSILTVTLGDVSQPVVVKDVQRHPARRQVLHLDFQRIREDEKITLSVPIHILGMDVAVGVKEQGGEVSVQLTEVEVSCLPKDLPEYIEIDISALELNQRLHLTDLQIPPGVELPSAGARSESVDRQHQPVAARGGGRGAGTRGWHGIRGYGSRRYRGSRSGGRRVYLGAYLAARGESPASHRDRRAGFEAGIRHG